MIDRPLHLALVVIRMDVGGLERYITRLANGLNREKFKVSIICLHRGGEALKWLERSDVKVIELGRTKGNSLGLISRLAKIFKDEEIDVVQSHNWATLIETYLAIRWTPRVAHVHTERGTVLGHQANQVWRQRLRALAMRWIVRKADGVVTNAFAVVDKIRSVTRLPKLPVTVIPNGLDTPYSPDQLAQFRGRIRSELGVSDTHQLIGSVGRLVPVKNFSLALNSLALAKSDQAKNAHLVLVGDGPCKSELSQAARSLGIEHRVHFPGNQADVWPYLAAMDLYLNTSVSEGMSQSILEAMAAGLPVLATDVGDARKMVTGHEPCGRVVVGSNNVESFSRELDEMLKDQESLREMSQKAKKVHAQYYSLSAMLLAFEDYYRDVWCNHQRIKDGARS